LNQEIKMSKLNYTKHTLLNATRKFIIQKILVIESALKETQTSANSDTKSSAGDKHETSRAMAHIENERLAGQLASLQAQLDVLNKINPEVTSEIVSFGSIIKTDSQVFFISTGIGKITTEEVTFYAIAANSPIGMKLIGKKQGETFDFNAHLNLINYVE
jgi:transcription elongation GreA/GreB family factor